MKNKFKLHYLFLALGLLVSTFGAISNNQSACSKHKNGTFIYYMKGASKNVKFTIKREDSIQTETNLSTGDYTKLQVKWISDCVYELKFLDSNLQYSDSIKQSLILRNEILVATENYYVFKSQAKNHDFVLVDTAWVKK